MGMSTHVYGIKPPDATWKKMKAVWDSCHEAGVNVPDDVERYFNGEEPDDDGVKIDLKDLVDADSSNGDDRFSVDIDKLPKGVKIVRFVNSY